MSFSPQEIEHFKNINLDELKRTDLLTLLVKLAPDMNTKRLTKKEMMVQFTEKLSELTGEAVSFVPVSSGMDISRSDPDRRRSNRMNDMLDDTQNLSYAPSEAPVRGMRRSARLSLAPDTLEDMKPATPARRSSRRSVAPTDDLVTENTNTHRTTQASMGFTDYGKDFLGLGNPSTTGSTAYKAPTPLKKDAQYASVYNEEEEDQANPFQSSRRTSLLAGDVEPRSKRSSLASGLSYNDSAMKRAKASELEQVPQTTQSSISGWMSRLSSKFSPVSKPVTHTANYNTRYVASSNDGYVPTPDTKGSMRTMLSPLPAPTVDTFVNESFVAPAAAYQPLSHLSPTSQILSPRIHIDHEKYHPHHAPAQQDQYDSRTEIEQELQRRMREIQQEYEEVNAPVFASPKPVTVKGTATAPEWVSPIRSRKLEFSSTPTQSPFISSSSRRQSGMFRSSLGGNNTPAAPTQAEQSYHTYEHNEDDFDMNDDNSYIMQQRTTAEEEHQEDQDQEEEQEELDDFEITHMSWFEYIKSFFTMQFFVQFSLVTVFSAVVAVLLWKIYVTYSAQIYCDSQVPPPVPVILASSSFSLLGTTRQQHNSHSDFSTLTAASGVTTECKPCPSLAFCMRGEAHCPTPFQAVRAKCPKADYVCESEAQCSDDQFLDALAHTVHTHAGRYDCQNSASPLSILNALLNLSLEDFLHLIPFAEYTIDDVPFFFRFFTATIYYFFAFFLYLGILVIKIVWPPATTAPPSAKFILEAELSNYVQYLFPHITPEAFPFVLDHVRTQLKLRSDDYRVGVLSFGELRTSPLFETLEKSVYDKLSNNSVVYISLSPSRPVLCALRFLMFEPLFILALIASCVAFYYIGKWYLSYRKLQCKLDARIAGVNHVLLRLKDAARDATQAQGAAHSRYQHEILQKKQAEDNTRLLAQAEKWSEEKLSEKLRQINSTSLRLADIVASAKRLALVRCMVLQEEVARDMDKNRHADLWEYVYHVIDTDRRVEKIIDKNGYDCWKWLGLKDSLKSSSNSNAMNGGSTPRLQGLATPRTNHLLKSATKPPATIVKAKAQLESVVNAIASPLRVFSPQKPAPVVTKTKTPIRTFGATPMQTEKPYQYTNQYTSQYTTKYNNAPPVEVKKQVEKFVETRETGKVSEISQRPAITTARPPSGIPLYNRSVMTNIPANTTNNVVSKPVTNSITTNNNNNNNNTTRTRVPRVAMLAQSKQERPPVRTNTTSTTMNATQQSKNKNRFL